MAIALSQFITGTAANASSMNVLFSSAVSSGSAISVWIGYFVNGAGNAISTVIDNVNAGAGFTARIFSTMSNAADTNAHLVSHDKLNISSGAAASTYRISINNTGTPSLSACASEFTGGTFTFGSTISANGTSSGAAGGALTASSTPFFVISGAIYNVAGTLFASTATGGATYMTTVDAGNANQVLNTVYTLNNSSLQKNIGHSLTVSTRWLAASILYTGAGGGGGATFYPNPWQMCMGGVQ